MTTEARSAEWGTGSAREGAPERWLGGVARPDLVGHGPNPDGRAWMRIGMILVYGGIGLVHLAAPDRFLPIMPDFVPQPRLVVILTGLAEIAGAIALMRPRWRRCAGSLFALYAICVYPANLKHAFAHIPVPPLPDTWWYHAPRLAFQPVMVWWALYAVHLIDWPFRYRMHIGPALAESELHRTDRATST